jgi:hypothetical protein
MTDQPGEVGVIAGCTNHDISGDTRTIGQHDVVVVERSYGTDDLDSFLAHRVYDLCIQN